MNIKDFLTDDEKKEIQFHAVSRVVLEKYDGEDVTVSEDAFKAASYALEETIKKMNKKYLEQEEQDKLIRKRMGLNIKTDKPKEEIQELICAAIKAYPTDFLDCLYALNNYITPTEENCIYGLRERFYPYSNE